MFMTEAINPQIVRFSLNHDQFIEDAEKLSTTNSHLYHSLKSVLIKYSGISWNKFVILTKVRLLESKFDSQSDIYSLTFCDDAVIIWAEVDTYLVVLTSIHKPKLK